MKLRKSLPQERGEKLAIEFKIITFGMYCYKEQVYVGKMWGLPNKQHGIIQERRNDTSHFIPGSKPWIQLNQQGLGQAFLIIKIHTSTTAHAFATMILNFKSIYTTGITSILETVTCSRFTIPSLLKCSKWSQNTLKVIS